MLETEMMPKDNTAKCIDLTVGSCCSFLLLHSPLMDEMC